MQEGEEAQSWFLVLISMLKYCYELGIKYVTIYAFSIDNFNRRPNKVQYVMDLMQEKIEGLLKEESIVNNYGIRVYFLGNLELLNEPVVRFVAEKAMAATAKNDKSVLMICVAYTFTDEIVHAIQETYNEKKDDIRHHEINKKLPIKLADLEKHMYMVVGPDPDILVRTSGDRSYRFVAGNNSYLQCEGTVWFELAWNMVTFNCTTRSGSAPKVEIGTALLDTYSKCGAIDASNKVCDQMLQESIVSWSAMIAAYGITWQ
ncbi:hypothetical protein GIB67_019997 [Kingdonia uniflora]|uniref:Alkyl transferase n=1 Tax=Kingdonia uniflora TaxID=39325 RepID=A0A7J7MKS0_9MAGN|nr:hypothetical protein GIB67_019997 [Kingdonia uniflora]